MIKTQRLTNGIRVVTEQMQGLRSVALGVFVGTGSVYEDSNNNGIAHMIEHMLFKGTQNCDAKTLADRMTMLGGNMNAYTAKECTSYYCRILDSQLLDAIEILGDMICNSKFDPKDISKEKQVILDEIDMYNDSPEDLVHELLQKKIWDQNSLGYIISGNKRNVKSFKQKDLLAFWKKNYYSSNIVISLAGSFEIEQVVEKLEECFSGVSSISDNIKVETPEYNQCFVKRHKDIEQAHINMAFKSHGYNCDDRYSVAVANAVLGGSLNSKLFQHIREELGLTYSIYSYESSYKDAGLFHIYASMNPMQVDYVLYEIRQCVENFVKTGVTKEELDKTKSQLITEYILGLESTSFRMENNARSLLLQDRVWSLQDIENDINKVTCESVKEYLEKYIRLDKCSLCVIGNMNDINMDKIRKVGG